MKANALNRIRDLVSDARVSVTDARDEAVEMADDHAEQNVGGILVDLRVIIARATDLISRLESGAPHVR